ncbi:hypothetical protein S83_047480, partial [Arachis hypogaea]
SMLKQLLSAVSDIRCHDMKTKMEIMLQSIMKIENVPITTSTVSISVAATPPPKLPSEIIGKTMEEVRDAFLFFSIIAKPPRSTLLMNGADVYEADTKWWVRRVAYYKHSLNIKLGTPAIRNVMDMNALFGSFVAALKYDPVWVINVLPACKPSSLDVVFDTGLIGVYHNWCEPFSKDPSSGKRRCNLIDLMVEIDRILQPEGTVVVRDSPEAIDKVARIARTVRWRPTIYDKEPESHGRDKILVATKTFWKLALILIVDLIDNFVI